MKPPVFRRSLAPSIFALAATAGLATMLPAMAAIVYVGDYNAGTVSAWDTDTGARLPGFSFTGTTFAAQMDVQDNRLYVTGASTAIHNATTGALLGSIPAPGPGSWGVEAGPNNDLYVAYFNNYVRKYDAATGADDPTFTQTPASGGAWGLELSGNSLFLSQRNQSVVSLIDATTGAMLNYNFISAFQPVGLAISGNTLYVAELGTGSVSLWNATTGALINPLFITGFDTGNAFTGDDRGISDIAIVGNQLFIADSHLGRVGIYDATTGLAIDPNFVTGLDKPHGIAAIVPEPAVAALALCGLAPLLARRRRK